ncbi:boophilin-H2-like isoform X1 [Sinocyclocheilus anshuiensis]|uniref:boophilin-H2-like isoform X1 n=1 Tax=Sinocyclocheilus anshuiensis TaxID=1608454 RepID=UPI0007BAAE98|nr:PREDICTED: boophilin-H2-like isoform X1 [Sinocyclocheilus anshuiensis]
MAPLLSWSCRPLLILPLIGICFTKFARADGVRSELHIFHHSCALKKDEGPCKAIKDRFYFDTDTGRCELFEYGGCQGNANNFETLQECEEMCLVKAASNHMEQNAPLKPEEEAKSKTEPLAKHVEAPLNASHLPLQRMSKPSAQEAEFNPPEFCLSPVDRGNCEGSERRFVYNPRTERCQMFRYSGCGGNKNNFVHKRHCMKMCMKDHRRKQIRIKTRNSNILFRSV